MFVVDSVGGTLTVKRAWDGTVLAAHTGGTISALRQLVVTRGDFGSTAATHLNTTAVVSNLVPYLIRDLALAEAQHQAWEEIGGYSDQQGSGNTTPSLGASLPDKWDEAETKYARKARIRVI
jgi:hypothetical protein